MDASLSVAKAIDVKVECSVEKFGKVGDDDNDLEGDVDLRLSRLLCLVRIHDPQNGLGKGAEDEEACDDH